MSQSSLQKSLPEPKYLNQLIKQIQAQLSAEHMDERIINTIRWKLKKIPELYQNIKNIQTLADICLKYAELITRFAYTLTESESNYMFCRVQVTQLFNVLLEIGKMQCLGHDFVEINTYEILERIINDPSIKSICLKELLIFLNTTIRCLNNSLRETISNSKWRILLFKLSDLLVACGDYECQLLVLELIFLMCDADTINSYAKDFFPNCESLQHALIQIDRAHFDRDARLFLNNVNAINGTVSSILADEIMLDQIPISGPQFNECQKLWVDFNKREKTIGILCDRDSLRTVLPSEDSSPDVGCELITLHCADIGSIRNKRHENTMTCCFQLLHKFHVRMGCSESITHSKYITLFIHSEDNMQKIKDILPQFFSDKYKNSVPLKSRSTKQLPTKHLNKLGKFNASHSIASDKSLKSLEECVLLQNPQRWVDRQCSTTTATHSRVLEESAYLEKLSNVHLSPDSTVPDKEKLLQFHLSPINSTPQVTPGTTVEGLGNVQVENNIETTATEVHAEVYVPLRVHRGQNEKISKVSANYIIDSETKEDFGFVDNEEHNKDLGNEINETTHSDKEIVEHSVKKRIVALNENNSESVPLSEKLTQEIENNVPKFPSEGRRGSMENSDVCNKENVDVYNMIVQRSLTSSMAFLSNADKKRVTKKMKKTRSTEPLVRQAVSKLKCTEEILHQIPEDEEQEEIIIINEDDKTSKVNEMKQKEKSASTNETNPEKRNVPKKSRKTIETESQSYVLSDKQQMISVEEQLTKMFTAKTKNVENLADNRIMPVKPYQRANLLMDGSDTEVVESYSVNPNKPNQSTQPDSNHCNDFKDTIIINNKSPNTAPGSPKTTQEVVDMLTHTPVESVGKIAPVKLNQRTNFLNYESDSDVVSTPTVVQLSNSINLHKPNQSTHPNSKHRNDNTIIIDDKASNAVPGSPKTTQEVVDMLTHTPEESVGEIASNKLVPLLDEIPFRKTIEQKPKEKKIASPINNKLFDHFTNNFTSFSQSQTTAESLDISSIYYSRLKDLEPEVPKSALKDRVLLESSISKTVSKKKMPEKRKKRTLYQAEEVTTIKESTCAIVDKKKKRKKQNKAIAVDETKDTEMMGTSDLNLNEKTDPILTKMPEKRKKHMFCQAEEVTTNNESAFVIVDTMEKGKKQNKAIVMDETKKDTEMMGTPDLNLNEKTDPILTKMPEKHKKHMLCQAEEVTTNNESTFVIVDTMKTGKKQYKAIAVDETKKDTEMMGIPDLNLNEKTDPILTEMPETLITAGAVNESGFSKVLDILNFNENSANSKEQLNIITPESLEIQYFNEPVSSSSDEGPQIIVTKAQVHVANTGIEAVKKKIFKNRVQKEPVGVEPKSTIWQKDTRKLSPVGVEPKSAIWQEDTRKLNLDQAEQKPTTKRKYTKKSSPDDAKPTTKRKYTRKSNPDSTLPKPTTKRKYTKKSGETNEHLIKMDKTVHTDKFNLFDHLLEGHRIRNSRVDAVARDNRKSMSPIHPIKISSESESLPELEVEVVKRYSAARETDLSMLFSCNKGDNMLLDLHDVPGVAPPSPESDNSITDQRDTVKETASDDKVLNNNMLKRKAIDNGGFDSSAKKQKIKILQHIVLNPQTPINNNCTTSIPWQAVIHHTMELSRSIENLICSLHPDNVPCPCKNELNLLKNINNIYANYKKD